MDLYNHWTHILKTHFIFQRHILEIFQFSAHSGPLRGNKIFEKIQKNMYPTLQSYIYEWK